MTSTAKKSSKNNGASFVNSFVRCELSDADREVIQDAPLGDSECLDLLETLAVAGIKTSFAYERQNDCVACYASGQETATDTVKGLTLSARGPDIRGALTVLAYKHYTLLKEDWQGNGQKSSALKYG